ncbi:hypothetical protein SAMN05216312_102237 [Cohnella sp. OV330]|uniref:hypothetical protein n=1 Tax=Cohnella sp. OV330 TaxID=1855288 RepID=UPI0008DEB399|nr:hypothetical protein [Cohnella sp. OV330]SFA91889.1 hypothetical protein SAMN05216312_102237 [Cohnella sp. OV330]
MGTRASADELEMIRDYLLLPFMITMAERGLEEAERSGNLLNRIFAEAAHVLITRMGSEAARLRKEFKDRGIKVHGQAEEEMENILMLRYNVRGYEANFGIYREVAKAQISVQLGQYIGEMVRDMNGMK